MAQVGRISNFDFNKKLSFGAEDTKVKETASKVDVDEDDEDDEEESFYERNKLAISTIGALALAGIAIAAHKHIKGKSPKKGRPEPGTPVTVEPPPKTEMPKPPFLVHKFIDDLEKLKSEDEITEALRKTLADKEPKVQVDIIKQLKYHCYLREDSLIGSKSWEPLFDTLVSIKPEGDRILAGSLHDTYNGVLNHLVNQEILNPEMIDAMVAKMPEMSDELKILTAHNLSQYHSSPHRIGYTAPIINGEQLQKVIEHVENIESSNVRFNSIVIYDTIKPHAVKLNLAERYFEKAPIDAEFTAYLDKILKGNLLEPQAKLKFIHSINARVQTASSPIWFSDVDQKEVKKVYKTLMKSLADSDFDGAETPDWAVSHREANMKFKVAEKVVANYKREFSPYSDDAEEYIRCLDNFIDSAKKARVSGIIDPKETKSSAALETLMLERLRVEHKAVVAKHSYSLTYEEALPCVEEMNKLFLKLKEEAVNWDDGVLKAFPVEYDSVSKTLLGRMQLNSDYETDTTKIIALEEKLKKFQEEHFSHKW